MYTKTKRTFLTLFAAVLLILGAPLLSQSGADTQPLGVLGLSQTAYAAEGTEGIYSYKTNGGMATITDVDNTVTGDVVIPEKLGNYYVDTIGGSAFSNCTMVESVTLSKYVINVDSYAFSGCTNLKSVDLGSAKYLGAEIFTDCPLLEEVTIPATFEDGGWSYPDGVLSNSSLKKVVFAEGVEKTSYCMMYNLATLEEVVIPNSMKEIDSYSFKNCRNLKNIDLKNVKIIGDEVFSGCEAFTDFVISDGVEKIGGWAFSHCKNLVSINLGKVKRLGTEIFTDCPLLEEVSIPATFEDGGCNYPNGVLSNSSLKKVVFAEGVEKTSYCMMYNLATLEEVVIPNSMKEIDSYSFKNCRNLKNIDLKNVKIIGDEVFSGCEAFTDFVISDGVEKIGGWAFSHCKNLVSINLGKVKRLGTEIFTDCPLLEEVSIPATFEDGGCNYPNGVLSNSSLKKVVFAEGVEKTSYCMMYNLATLEEVVIPNSMKEIDSYSFKNCRNLKNIDLKNVKIIGDEVFSGCEAFTDFVISDGVEKIGGWAFSHCKNLVSINLGKIKRLGAEIFTDCPLLEEVTIPATFEDGGWSYPDGVLSNSSLKKVVFAEGVEKTSYCMMYNLATLEEVVIPNSMKEIDSYSFKNCRNLKAIKLPCTVKEISDSAFDGVTSLTVTCVKGSVADTYAKAHGFAVDNSIAHKWDNGKITTAAKCETDGIKTFTCIYCGAARTEKIAKLGHSFSTAWTTDKASTCTAQGSKSRHCTRCNAKTDVTALPLLKHSYKIAVTKPTCTANGFTTHTCSVCKASYKDSVVKATGHKLKTTTAKATLTKDGKTVTACTVCKKVTKTVVIPKVSNVKISATNFVYDGKAKTPSVTVKDSKGKTLKNGTDYTLTYSKKGAKAIGKYIVKVTLKGNYSGTKSFTYYIRPANIAKITVKQTTNSITASWKAVKGANGYRVFLYNTKTKKFQKVGDTAKTSFAIKKLKAGTAYKIAVQAYGKQGKTIIWAAKQTAVNAATKPATPKLTVKAGAKKAALSWNKQTCTGYEIFMATKKDGKYKKLATVKNAKTVKYTAKNLKKGQTVYFKIRAYKTVGKTNVYSAYSAVKAVKIK